MSEEREYVSSATLIVLGDELDPRRVTELLGLEPSQAWRRGERKSFVRNDGTLHYFDSVYEWGGWKRFIPDHKQNAELAEQLSWWCDELRGRATAMRELEAQGCSLHIDCFVGSSNSVSIELSAELQNRLSRLALNLTVFFSAETSLSADAEQALGADSCHIRSSRQVPTRTDPAKFN